MIICLRVHASDNYVVNYARKWYFVEINGLWRGGVDLWFSASPPKRYVLHPHISSKIMLDSFSSIFYCEKIFYCILYYLFSLYMVSELLARVLLYIFFATSASRWFCRNNLTFICTKFMMCVGRKSILTVLIRFYGTLGFGVIKH